MNEFLILTCDESSWVSRKYGRHPYKDRNAAYKRPVSWDVWHNGERIGKVIYAPEKMQWCRMTVAHYAPRYVSGDDQDAYISDEYSTLYAAKMAVLKAYKENGSQPKKRAPDISYLPSGNSDDFYPTPSAIAGRMFKLVNWQDVQSICEPSAGKGDLLDNLKAFIRNARIKIDGHYYSLYDRKDRDIDCIEIDKNLQYILIGKGYRVVHDDFLSYNTRKCYDVILMNPPFAEGDKHLIKALQMQENGGQIVCLLNAETIRNPYTNMRKALSDMLAKYGAKIEFIENAFSRAERPSDVEIALVYVNIPRKTFESDIWEHMKAAQNVKFDGPDKVRDLAPDNLIDRMIREYEIEVDASLAFMREFNALLPHIMNSTSQYAHPLIALKIDDNDVYKYGIGTEAINSYMRAVRYKYWEELLNDDRITGKLTSKLSNQYHDSVTRMQDYDFSKFNIMQIICDIGSKLTDGVHESIMALFDQMSAQHSWYPECEGNVHYFNGWATNKAHKINNKVILPINGFGSYSWETKKLDTYSIHKTITDIEKVLDYLDGRKTWGCDTWGFINQAANRGETKNIHCKYFGVTFYKKGTCHIKFHEQRIVDILNIYGARHRNWLPPSYGKQHYKDMSAEAKTVIDEFQGAEAYEQVMQNPKEYIIEAAEIYKALPAAV